jgi:hypothetical protein
MPMHTCLCCCEVALAGCVLAASPASPWLADSAARCAAGRSWACRYAPWLVRLIVSAEAHEARRRPLPALRKSFQLYTSATPADATALARPDVEEAFLESSLEQFLRHQERAVLAGAGRCARCAGARAD